MEAGRRTGEGLEPGEYRNSGAKAAMPGGLEVGAFSPCPWGGDGVVNGSQGSHPWVWPSVQETPV